MCNTYGDDDEKRERRRRQRQKCFNVIKKCVAFMFSHIGLAAMVVAYSIAGGFLFRALEAPYEYREKLKIKAFKDDKIKEIVKYTYHLNLGNIDSDNFTSILREIFLEFQNEVTLHVKEKGWDGRDATDETDLQWSFAGALLYAVTVTTTIGYGHVAPKTGPGRFVTILYALVGIPLTFLYLSNIGNFLADCFRLFYKKICCDLCCCQKCERKRKRERLRAKRRKEIAAQRNSLLQQASLPATITTEPQFHIQDETSMSDDLEPNAVVNQAYDDTVDPDTGQPIAMNIGTGSEDEPKLNNLDKSDNRHKQADDECKLKGGCPLSVQEEMGMDLQENNQSEDSATGGGNELLDDDNLKETAILDDDLDSLRETAILDDNTSDDNLSSKLPSRKPSMKKDIDGLNLPSSKSKMDGIYNQLEDVKETAILDSEDGLSDDDDDEVFVDSEEGQDRIDSGDENFEGLNTLERKEKLSRKEKRLKERMEKEKRRQEKKEKKERERKERQEKKEKEKLEKELKERERKSLKEKEKEAKRQKSRDRSKSSEKGKHKKEDKSALVFNETPGVNFSDKTYRSQSPTIRQISKLDRSPTPRGSPRSNHRSQLVLKDSPRISRSKSFQERKKDKPKVGDSPSRSRSMKESDFVKSENDLVNSERNYGTLKDMPQSKKLKREKTAKFKLKQQESKKRSKDKVRNKQGSVSADDMRNLEGAHENRNRAYHASDESFVTARADSEPNIGETSTSAGDDDETGELGMPGTPVIKYNPDTLTVEVGDGQFDIELLEYPHLHKDGGPMSFVEDPFDYDEEEDDGKVTVPISICLILITGYILAGSVLFTLWEDWDLLTGSYFCFITLSTIGFGDIVPGTDMKEWESNEKLVLCALWLAFGLSLLAMCFNLMQEEVKEKCKWIGQKLGLLRNEDDG